MNFARKLSVWSWLGLFTPLLSTPVSVTGAERPGGLPTGVDPGELKVLTIGGKPPASALQLPLTHTDVKIMVTGFVAQATVIQDYSNPLDKPIEAVYTFPLPHKAAVDSMTMHVGDRVIRSLIKKRDEARQMYEAAKSAGQRTALLEQERPNIFTQSVGNILPGDKIRIEITYVDLLDYRDEGAFELVFPMVVGPRYIPGKPQSHSGSGFAQDTDRVSDASRITPPVLKPGERSGHDIALSVNLDAHLKIQGIHSTSHSIDITAVSDAKNLIKLRASDTIPNKDFILRYEVAGKAPEMAVIAHHDSPQGGYFTFIALPQQTIDADSTVPRDLIFILDTSGSMEGIPMEQSKRAMYRLIDGMRTTDRFNVVRFAGDTGTLWPAPRLKTKDNVELARSFVASLQGSGGTEMLNGINEALSQPADGERVRLAFLLTDGYVGNEDEILANIEKERRGARVFTLGVGSSVNRYLLDQAATVGLGESFYVRQDEDATNVISKIFKRVDRPNLAHLEINWNGLDVTDVTPSRIPDLWQGRPILVHGRYKTGGSANITVKGVLGAKEQVWQMPVTLPTNTTENAVMAAVWARAKVEELMLERTRSSYSGEKNVPEITDLGLKYRLMTQWTSFVAVEEKIVNKDGKSTTVVQPVEIPEGVSYEGVFGKDDAALRDGLVSKGVMPYSSFRSYGIPRGGIGGGGGGGGVREFAMLRPEPRVNALAVMSAPTSVSVEPVADFGMPPGKKEAAVKSSTADEKTINCQYKALSVSGALKYPAIYKRLREVWPALCKSLKSYVNSSTDNIAINLTISAAGKVTTVSFPNTVAEPLATAIVNSFKAITFTTVTEGETVIKLVLVLK